MRFDAQTVGETIRRVRIEKRLSQEVLSGLADVGRSHLAMIETGKKRANLDTIAKLSCALGLKPSEFIRMVEQKLSGEESE